MTRRMKAALKKPEIIVKSNGEPVIDAELLAFVTRAARENRYDPDKDPVVRKFRKRMGIVKIGSN